MEQKRLFWILSAAGVFLCIVIGSAFFVYGHGAAASKNATAISLRDSGSIWVSSAGGSPSTAQYNGYIAEHQNTPEYQNSLAAGISVPEEAQPESGTPLAFGTQNEETATPYLTITQDATERESPQGAEIAQSITPAGANVTFIATTNVYQVPDKGQSTVTFDLNSSYSGEPAGSSVIAQNKAAEDAMKVTEAAKKQRTYGAQESASAKPKTSVQSSGIAQASAKPTASQEKSAATVKESVSTTVTTNTQTQKTNITSSAPVVAQTLAPVPDRFWVQAASYSTKKKADEARTVLDENQIQCEVFTYEDDKGSLFYRVRVGPYTTRDEASYWKNKIDALELFAKAGTYIVNSSAPIAKK